MANKKKRARKKQPEDLIRELSEGNPLLDQSAYERALARCPDDDSREALRAMRARVKAALERADGEAEDEDEDCGLLVAEVPVVLSEEVEAD